jgi:CrcB protein
MVELVLIGLGGFVGAIARYGLSGLVHRFWETFPAGTLVVNVLGCLVIGALISLVEERQLFAANTRLFLQIGLLGSFTTFSTLGYETFELMQSGDYWLAGINVAANVVLGIGAVAVGMITVRALGT